MRENPPSTLELIRELLECSLPPDTEQRAELKRQWIEDRQFGRVDALAQDVLPSLSTDALSRLSRHVKKELATRKTNPRSPYRGRQSREDREEKEQLAYELHAALTQPPFDFSSQSADELVGLTMYADKRTAQRYRNAYADRLHKTKRKTRPRR